MRYYAFGEYQQTQGGDLLYRLASAGFGADGKFRSFTRIRVALAEQDPVVNVFVDYRSRLTQLDPRWMGGEMWGWSENGELTSVCHAAANLNPAAKSSFRMMAGSIR